MAITATNLTEMLNLVINKALGGGITQAAIATELTARASAVTAIGATYTHSRTIQDPGPALNPSLPQPP
jgi:alkylation response protein AidB-like acyl-CoA dehydrogenase